MNLNATTIFALVILLFLLAAIILSLAFSASNFIQSLKYVNLEIKRADKKDRKKWKRRKFKMWIHFLFPFLK